MRDDIENATFKPEVITVKVTEADVIKEVEEEGGPRIFGQLKYFFGYTKKELWERNRYKFLTTMSDDPDLRPLCVSYDSDKKLIQLSYDFGFDNPLMAYFFFEDSFDDIPAKDIESTRAVTKLLPALINKHTETSWLCYDKENDSMWITTGIYVTGTKLDKKYLTMVLEEIVRCRNLCLHILENVVYGNDASNTERDIRALIQSYSGPQGTPASDAQD